MDIIQKIDLMLGEMDGGDMGGTPGTTTSKVVKIPMGTKKMFDEEEEDEEEEIEKKQKKDTDTMGEL